MATRPRATARKLLAVGFQQRVSGKADRLEDQIVRKHLMWASATLAMAIGALSACGGSPTTSSASPASNCVNASATHHAYVVVQHGSGTTLQKCVGFTGDTIDGQALMDQSGLAFQTQTFSFGKAVCQIDNEPAAFTKCFASTGPNWTLFVESSGSWKAALTDYTQATLHDKDALGWRYMAYAESPSPPPLPKSS
jgi:hypothetical protein